MLVDPGDQEEVQGPGVQDRGAGEARVGEGVADRADTDLVNGALLLEQLDDLHRLAAGGGGGVESGEGVGMYRIVVAGCDTRQYLGSVAQAGDRLR